MSDEKDLKLLTDYSRSLIGKIRSELTQYTSMDYEDIQEFDKFLKEIIK